MESSEYGGWRAIVFWLGISVATLIAGFVGGWLWGSRTGILASVRWMDAVTAVGTLGTAIVAAWLGLRDGFRLRRERSEEAQVIRAVLAHEIKQFAFHLENSYWALSNLLSQEKIHLSRLDRADLAKLKTAADLPTCKQQQGRLQRLPGPEGLAIASVLGKAGAIISACDKADMVEIIPGEPSSEFVISDIENTLSEFSQIAQDLLPVFINSSDQGASEHLGRLRGIVKKESQRMRSSAA